jgi:hypothetical protein
MAQCAHGALEEDVMSFDLEPSQDLGLKHLLRNGVRILDRDDLAQERRAEVLEDLLSIVSDAESGSEALSARNLTFALQNAQAFEKFSLFFRYLNDSREDLAATLKSAKTILEDLRSGGAVAAARKSLLKDLLSDLLEALKRERAFAPLQGPRDFYYP